MTKHKHGGDIYSQKYKTDYSANINPLGPPAGVLLALQECAGSIQNYPDVRQRRLRRALSKQEQIEADDIIFGNGAAELIFALALGCRPKRALLAVPGFAEYEEALRAADCEISYYHLKEENGFLLGEDYLDMIQRDLDILFLCNPNNPTGTLISRDMLIRIAEKSRENQVLMVVDECFNGFLDRPEDYQLKAYLSQYPNLFLLNAFTKLYAMPGLRLGYGYCSNKKVLQQMQRVMQPWSISIPAQAAGVAALGENKYVEAARALIKAERAHLTEGLKSLGLTVWEGAANYIFFKGEKGLEKELKDLGYLIRDCSNYQGLCRGYYRIAVRTREENTKLLVTFQQVLVNSKKEAVRECAAEMGTDNYGKKNNDTGNHVKCGKESADSRSLQNI